MPLYFLTTSKNKFAEVQRFFPEVEMLSVDLPEIQEFDLQKIIEQKLESGIIQITNLKSQIPNLSTIEQFFVEDSALYIRCMNGFPGPLIKWMEKQMKAEGIANLVMQHPERRAT